MSIKKKAKDPVKSSKELLTTKGRRREKVFFSNDNANVKADLKAWLECEYPRYFDPLNPLNFHDMEQRLLKELIKIETFLKSRLDASLEKIEDAERLSGETARLYDQHKSLVDQMTQLTYQADRIESQFQKLMGSSLWTKVRFLFFR